MNKLNRRQFTRLVAALPLLVGPSAGCHALNSVSATIPEGANAEFLAKAAAQGEVKQASAESTPTCVVQIREENAKPQSITIPLDKELHVQDLLEKTGVTKRFRRMDLALVRTTPAGRSHRMAVVYDRSEKKVERQYDYFVRSGDVLIVTEDTSTVLDDVMNRMGAPWGKKPPNQEIRG